MALADAVTRAQETMSREVARTAPTVVDPNYATDILKQVGLDPNDPRSRAVVAVARRYNLDPVLGHIEIIAKSRRPYITRDGYIHIAHAAGQLDGIEVTDGPRRDGREWVATVTVWRKDMSHAFVYPGRADLAADNGPELAIARAERRALKRAFAVTLPREFDEGGDEPNMPAPAPTSTEADEPTPAQVQTPAEPEAHTEAPTEADDPGGPRVTPQQRRAIFAECNRLGLADDDARGARLRLWAGVTGREVASTNELSEVEASAIITVLRNMTTGEGFAPDKTEASKND